MIDADTRALPAGLAIDIAPEVNPWTGFDIPDASEHFSFVLISDRTGGARPGIFEAALATTDLLAPSFAIQLGDMIEGYSFDPAVIETEWAEMDDMFAGIQTAIFHVPGNHDISSDFQLKYWQQRYGRTYFSFRYADTLFLVLDTMDTPDVFGPEVTGLAEQFNELIRRNPRLARQKVAEILDWEGTQPGKLSEEQLRWAEETLASNNDARWTFITMHMPMWQGDHPAWQRIRRSLGNRRYHAFAGHVHNYQHRHIDGNAHVRLGPTGGLWVLGGPEGNFDHVTQVTMTARGPVLANILLEGVRDLDGQPVLPVATRSIPIY